MKIDEIYTTKKTMGLALWMEVVEMRSMKIVSKTQDFYNAIAYIFLMDIVMIDIEAARPESVNLTHTFLRPHDFYIFPQDGL